MMTSENMAEVTFGVKSPAKKTRKQTRFSLAASPLGTITNLVLPGEGSPAKSKEQIQTPDEEKEYDDDENEVFFGAITDYEKRKASKMRRRTVLYTPSFRANLAKTPSKGSTPNFLSSSDESQTDGNDQTIGNTADGTGPVDNFMNVTSDSVFDDDTTQKDDSEHNKRTSSIFYSTSEYHTVESIQNQTNCNETIYHQALSVTSPVSDVTTPRDNTRDDVDLSISDVTTPRDKTRDDVKKRLLLTSSEDTPTNKLQDSVKDDMLKSIGCNSTSDSPAEKHLAASKIQGWFRMSKQKRVYNTAFDNMSSLKDKTNKFLEELRTEQRSRGNTPTNSPLPCKVAKKCVDDDGENNRTETDGCHSGMPVPCLLQETAHRLHIASGKSTPTRSAATYHGLDTPPKQANYGGTHNRCNSPLVFSSPKVYPVTVQAQSSRNPMCSVATYSPRPITSTGNLGVFSFPSPASSHQESSSKPSPAVVIPKALRSVHETSGSPNIVRTPGSIFGSNLSPFVQINSSGRGGASVLSTGSAFAPLAIKIEPQSPGLHNLSHGPIASVSLTGPAFTPLAVKREPQTPQNLSEGPAALSLTGSAFTPLMNTSELHQSPFKMTASTTTETSNKENITLDSPNVTSRRSKRRNADKQTCDAPGGHSLPVQASEIPGNSSYAQSPARMYGVPVAPQQCANVNWDPNQAVYHQQTGQMVSMSPMNHLSLLQQKREELARIQAQKYMIQRKIQEDNQKCFQMRHEIMAALRSNSSPEGLPMDTQIAQLRPHGTSTLTLNDAELDIVTRLHTIRNSNAEVTNQYDSPVAHRQHRTGRGRIQWHEELETPVTELSSPHLLYAPVTAHSILYKK